MNEEELYQSTLDVIENLCAAANSSFRSGSPAKAINNLIKAARAIELYTWRIRLSRVLCNDSYEIFYRTGGHVGPFNSEEVLDAAFARANENERYVTIWSRSRNIEIARVYHNNRVQLLLSEDK